MKLLPIVLAALLACSSTRAFAPPPSSELLTRRSPSFRTRVAPLNYRELDESDDPNDPAMLRVMSRAPPAFDVRQSIQEQQAASPKNGVNQGLIRALTANQFLILGLATAISAGILFFKEGSSAFANLNDIFLWTGTGGGKGIFDFSISAKSLLYGVGGALPLLAFSAAIENSDKRVFANINFATITMCLTCFGRRNAPPDELLPPQLKGKTLPTTKPIEAFVPSLLMSAVTGFCEEAVFRRQVPAMLALLYGSGSGDILTPYLGQALLFGVGHLQPGNQPAENAVLLGLQTVNGLGFGLIYILSSGDIVSCMIAHCLYDTVTFFKTWKDANDQIDYADQMYLQPFSPDIDREVRRVLSQSKMDSQQFKKMKRLFYTFDFDKNKTLSLSEVRKGIAYMNLAKAGTPPPEAAIDAAFKATVQSREHDVSLGPRLTFADFLRLYATTEKNKMAGGGRKQLVRG